MKTLSKKTKNPQKVQLADELWDADPECKHVIIGARGGGVKCTKCRGWFCF